MPKCVKRQPMSLSELKEAPMGDGLLAALPTVQDHICKSGVVSCIRDCVAPKLLHPLWLRCNDSASEIRCAALGVLGYLKSDAGLSEIARIAGTDPDPEARRIAGRCAGFRN